MEEECTPDEAAKPKPDTMLIAYRRRAARARWNLSRPSFALAEALPCGSLPSKRCSASRLRAAYGEAMLEELSRRLMAEFGRGLDVTALHKVRQFHRMVEIRDALRRASAANTARHKARDELSWGHCRLPMQFADTASQESWRRLIHVAGLIIRCEATT